ncbi:MAG: di-heme oxidoredictase family protein [Blastocatellia bacterium]
MQNENSADEYLSEIGITSPLLRDEYLAATAEARAGESLFNQIGCSICHTPQFITTDVGTFINVGTGDGIVQNGGPSTRNKMRTPLLWSLRARNRLMHDGQSLSFDSAILKSL